MTTKVTADLLGTIPNSNLANTSVTLNGTSVSLGGSATIPGSSITSIPNASLTNSTISGVSLGSNLGTLSMGVSGTGLSGSNTYNGSGGSTFTVTSNATNANTAGAIVARDSSGNFSAGIITASLNGNANSATSATTATNIAGGSTNQLPLQSSSATTSFISAPSSSYQYLYYNGANISWGSPLFSFVGFPTRSVGTTYTNSTGKPMMVCVSAQFNASSSANYYYFNVNGQMVQVGGDSGTYSGGATYLGATTVIVPPGATYSVTQQQGTINQILSWAEIY